MGMCLDDIGRIGIEVRRESFVIHPSYGYDKTDTALYAEPQGCSEHECLHDFGKSWRDNPHPELLLEDLDDLITALQQAKAYLERNK